MAAATAWEGDKTGLRPNSRIIGAVFVSTRVEPKNGSFVEEGGAHFRGFSEGAV